jgi:hypothetical protein
MDLEAARADADAKWTEADKEIAKFLENPVVRERVEREFADVHQRAAAQVEHAKATYQQGLAQNAAAALAVLTTQFPEFAGLSGAQLEGALRVSNTQRADAFRQLAGQVSTVVGSFQQRAAQEQAQQQAAYMARLDQFKAAEDRKFDAATAHENPETLKTFRSNVFPMLETHYGIPQARMRALASGQQAMNSVELLHSSEFQRILLDALKWQSAQTAVRNAAVRPVPQVQRPGVSTDPSNIDDGEVSAARARFTREGGNVGRDGLRNAAALVAARRARS